MIKRKITNQNYNQLVTRGKGNSDTKAHQHGKAGSITVSWNNGSGAGSVVVAQRATTSVFVQRLTCRWSGNRQKHRMTTQSWRLSCIGSGIAGCARMNQTINGSHSEACSISTLTKAMATVCWRSSSVADFKSKEQQHGNAWLTASWCSGSSIAATAFYEPVASSNNQSLQSVMKAHTHSDWAGDSKQASITGAVMHRKNSGGGVAVSGWRQVMALAENNSFR